MWWWTPSPGFLSCSEIFLLIAIWGLRHWELSDEPLDPERKINCSISGIGRFPVGCVMWMIRCRSNYGSRIMTFRKTWPTSPLHGERSLECLIKNLSYDEHHGVDNVIFPATLVLSISPRDRFWFKDFFVCSHDMTVGPPPSYVDSWSLILQMSFLSCSKMLVLVLVSERPRGGQVKEICTIGSNMVAAKRSDSIDTCVKKMINADVRHLPVIDDDTGEVFGLISVKVQYVCSH